MKIPTPRSWSDRPKLKLQKLTGNPGEHHESSACASMAAYRMKLVTLFCKGH